MFETVRDINVTSISNVDGIVISLSTLLRNLRTVESFKRDAHHDLLDIVALSRISLTDRACSTEED